LYTLGLALMCESEMISEINYKHLTHLESKDSPQPTASGLCTMANGVKPGKGANISDFMPADHLLAAVITSRTANCIH
jgi:hypothetical protein